MDKNNREYAIPNHVLHALIAGVLFLLAATILGLLMFYGDGASQHKRGTDTRETVEKHSWDERPVVVIDAGHGGSDPGAVCDFATETEADITQKVADRLVAYLQQHSHEIRVELSHAPGAYATIQARANAALHLEADVLLSLHLNADSSPSTRGFQVYPTPPGRIHHEASLRLAGLLVEQVRQQTKIPIKGDNGVFYAYYHEVPGGGYRREQLDMVWADAYNPSPSPSFGVVEKTGCPAVLVEQWFITSREDMALMNDEQGYDIMARSLYLALCSYFEVAPLDK